MANPARGEVWLTDLGYVAKVRPCLVLSVPFVGDERSLVTLVPHTASPRSSRFAVPLALPFPRPGVFDAQSLVTVPAVKLLRRPGTLSGQHVASVEAAVAAWLALRLPPP